jgi:putative nucleotidyltransferase with HDIG domain
LLKERGDPFAARRKEEAVEPRIVLFVDDDPEILKVLRRMVRGDGLTVLTATGPEHAFEILKGVEIPVVVSDHQMPEMLGVDFLAALRERHPESIRILLTGQAEMQIAVEAINRGEIYRMITKPCRREELRGTLGQAFEHFEMRREIERLDHLARDRNEALKDLNRELEAKVRERTHQLAASNRDLRLAYVQTIGALAEAIDAKDPYTRGHSDRVGVYASRIAREMGLQRKPIERIYIAGLLHDVGKIGVPDAIIAKPGRLTESETRQIREHVTTGARILGSVVFLADVVPCVLHHHEWFDGSARGYPGHLAGAAIPLPSRVIAVADTVEAMTSDRPYRKALPLETVLREIHRFRGSQFDPVVADAFLAMAEREGESFLRRDAKFDLAAFLEA